MRKTPPGLNPEYIRLRDAREARRREVDRLVGFEDAAGRGWSKAERRRAAMRRGNGRS